MRVNPEYSEVGTDLYNPCAPGTRFGVSADKLPQELPSLLEGFHCHCHCESGSDVFVRTLKHIEEKFSPWFSQLKWINFGGGHLMTRADYDVELLISTLQEFKKRYPHVHVILEPGSACHMPDCLEMPYMPTVRNAVVVGEEEAFHQSYKFRYRLGGNSCLSGDFMGDWLFDHELQVGENIIFEDMLHYTTVKTNMFNGITHPSIALLKMNGELEILRKYDYNDYKSRMD